MKKRLLHILLLGFATLLTACSDNPQELDYTGLFHNPSESVQTRFDQYMDWNANHPAFVETVTSDDYRLFFCSDVHYREDRNQLEPFLKLSRNDATCPFIIINGDLSDHEAGFDTVQARILRHYAAGGRLVYTTAGNHDLYFGRWLDFFNHFGSSTYVVKVQGPGYEDIFIFLDSANGTLGRSQLKWLKEQLEGTTAARHITVVTHNNLFNQDQNQGRCSTPPMDEVYQITHLMEKHGVEACIQSHNHYPSLTTFKGIQLVVTPALQDGGYITLDYTTDKISTHFYTL